MTVETREALNESYRAIRESLSDCTLERARTLWRWYLQIPGDQRSSELFGLARAIARRLKDFGEVVM